MSVKWSYTAVNTLRQCNRKYYFSNVLATHGRKVPVRRKAYELKSMQNLTMWRGSVVDKFMETVVIPLINEKENLDFDALAAQAVALAKRQFQYSLLEIYTDPTTSKGEVGADFCILDIHAQGVEYKEEDITEAYNAIHQAIVGLQYISMPDGQLLINYLKQCNALTPNVNNWAVYIENAMVKPQIDLIALKNWKPVVIDWKLSASYTSDYANQLIICGITVYLKRLEKTDKPKYEYADIKLFEVNLLSGIVKEHEFTEDKINRIIDDINLTSQDISLLTGKVEEIDIEDFELTDDEVSCKFCNYRSLCSYLLLNNNNYDEKSYTEFVQSNQLA
jgi:hypothetical protein